MVNVIIPIVILLGITAGILWATGVFNSNSNKSNKNPGNGSNPGHAENTPNYPYITPQPFETGFLKNTPQKIANLCTEDDKNATLYTVQPPYVDYGEWDCDERCCDVVKFNSPP